MNDDQLEDSEDAPVPPIQDESEDTFKAGSKKSSPSLMTRILRWILGLLILVGTGSILILVTLYIPLRNELHDANQQLEVLSSESTTELEAARQEIKRLTSLQETNTLLQEELTQANIKVALLGLRLDVANAKLALNAGENNNAQLSLSKTSVTLKELEKLLAPDQRSVIADMQSRLKLILSEIELDTYAALSDLDVLANSLLTLESKLNQ